MELQTVIDNYICSDTAKEIVRQTNIILLVGISGAGKDTIKNELIRQPGFATIVSCTTRLPRLNNGVMEQDGLNYHFISETQAADLAKNHEFIEVKLVHNVIYGTPVSDIKRAHEAGNTIVKDVDVQGAAVYYAISPKVKPIFIVPPSYEEWMRRLQKRYDSLDDFKAAWPVRRQSASFELSEALSQPYYQFVQNNKLDDTLAIVKNIAAGHSVLAEDAADARQVAIQLLAAISD
jgi:guanylate kinase